MLKHISRLAVVLIAVSIGSAASAAPKAVGAPGQTDATATDNMTRYRTLATDALTAFKAGDMAAAKAKSRELEKAWDGEQKELKSKSPDVWTNIDNAMDAFIKPIMKEKSPDAAKVQAAYDDFIAKLQTAVK